MKIEYGDGKTKYGSGVSIYLTGEDVAIAIETWLVAHNVYIHGSRTITVNNELCEVGHVYIDPSGFVVHNVKRISGRGVTDAATLPPGETTEE